MKSAMSISIPSHRLVERLRSMTDAAENLTKPKRRVRPLSARPDRPRAEKADRQRQTNKQENRQ